MKRRRFLVTSVLVLGLFGSARAETFFTNLLQDLSASMSLNDKHDRVATDFQTGTLSASITGVTAVMTNTSRNQRRVVFSIYEDNGSGQPGALVDIFDTSGIVVADNNAQTVTSTDPGITLQPNTTYWLVGQLKHKTILGDVNWWFDTGESSTGSFSAVPATEILRISDDDVSYIPNDSGNLMFALQGVTIPEPSSLTLIAFAAAGIAGCARRRKLE